MLKAYRRTAWEVQALVLAYTVLLLAGSSRADLVVLTTNQLGATPEMLAYNSGHFYPGSNTRDWWRYAGVTGARLFISPSEIEPSDDLAPVGDGVTNQVSFLARKAALRADPLNPAFINWGGSTVFSNRYESNDLYPNNHIRVNYALGELRRLGVRVCAQITASQSRFPIADTDDWPNMWELWQHYYAQAFYLGRVFDVERYQMFNEPNHPNANGLTITNHLLRLQLVSDAVQSALADVNRLYGKALSPRILAPVTAGSANGSYPGWGESVVTNRHRNFLGEANANFSLLHVYDYHQYNSSPATFGNDLANLHALLTVEMSPEPRFPSSISEFNTRTGATYDGIPETLDTPAEYSRFGAIAANLLASSCAELYCFKFSQTLRDAPTTYPVQKNAMHYVDNNNAPYNVGGITRAGEVWRLVNKAFVRGRYRIGAIKTGAATNLDLAASLDPAGQRVYLFCANTASGSVVFDLDLTAFNVPAGNTVLVEEVSETCYGGVRAFANPAAGQINVVQSPNSVSLITIPIAGQQAGIVVNASQDATVLDGDNRNANYGFESSLRVRNDPTNASNRSVTVIKFQLPTNDLSSLEMGLLELNAATITVQTTAQAHVYGCANTNWAESTVNWTTAPGLKKNLAAGATIDRRVVEEGGSDPRILGQLVVNSTNSQQKAIDVTTFLRSLHTGQANFLISQDPRWNVDLPSLAMGDVQLDGLKIGSREGGAPARLRLFFRDAAGGTNQLPQTGTGVFLWTNVSAAAEASVRGGASAGVDQDEAGIGYLMAKYNLSPFDNARKIYLQFDLSGLTVEQNTQAVLTVQTYATTFPHRIQCWGLNQAYRPFDVSMTWSNAPANELYSNNLLTNGPVRASPLGAPSFFPGSGSTTFSFVIPRLGDHFFEGRVTLVLTGAPDASGETNNAGGFRLQLGGSSLRVLARFPTLHTNSSQKAVGIVPNKNGSITLAFVGQPLQTFWVQAIDDLLLTNWLTIGTSSANLNGTWSFTDDLATNYPRRFYRSMVP